MMRGLGGVGAGVLLFALGACDTGDGDGDAGDGGTAQMANCETEDRADPYQPGMFETGSEGVTVTLERSVPAPPEKGDNEWTITVVDDQEATLDGLELAVIPTMPDHGHGTPVQVEVEPGEEPGEYVLSPVNLMMAGYWEVLIELHDEQGPLDEVTFRVCVEE